MTPPDNADPVQVELRQTPHLRIGVQTVFNGRYVNDAPIVWVSIDDAWHRFPLTQVYRISPIPAEVPARKAMTR